MNKKHVNKYDSNKEWKGFMTSISLLLRYKLWFQNSLKRCKKHFSSAFSILNPYIDGNKLSLKYSPIKCSHHGGGCNSMANLK